MYVKWWPPHRSPQNSHHTQCIAEHGGRRTSSRSAGRWPGAPAGSGVCRRRPRYARERSAGRVAQTVAGCRGGRVTAVVRSAAPPVGAIQRRTVPVGAKVVDPCRARKRRARGRRRHAAGRERGETDRRTGTVPSGRGVGAGQTTSRRPSVVATRPVGTASANSTSRRSLVDGVSCGANSRSGGGRGPGHDVPGRNRRGSRGAVQGGRCCRPLATAGTQIVEARP